jgi:acetate---CoA ligase (ADP-forming)
MKLNFVLTKTGAAAFPSILSVLKVRQLVPNHVIQSLLWPNSVAVVGADPDPTRMNGAPVRNLLDFGFRGSIFPVTTRASEIQGIPTFTRLSDISEKIDTVVIAVKAERAVEYLQECGELGIGTATIVSAGFAEGAAKESGDALTKQLRSIINRYRIRVLGPNTAGLANLRHHYVPRAALNHFSPEETVVGGTAVICQSGAISNIIFNKCIAHNVGVAYSLATGDQVDLDVWDFVAYALTDDAVSQVLCVAEGLQNASRVADVANLAGIKRKPVVLLKLGRSTAGARMVATHSGSMAGSYDAFHALAHQSGFIEVTDIDSFWEIASLFDRWGVGRSDPPPTGRVGAFAISGGDAAYIADKMSSTSLELPHTSEAFDSFVSGAFSFAAGGNPFDCTGEVLAKPALLADAVQAFVEANSFDYTLIAAPVFRSELATKIYPKVIEGLGDRVGRVAISAWSAGKLTDAGIAIFRGAGLPVFEQSGRAVRAIEFYDHWMRTDPVGVQLVFPGRDASQADPYYSDLRQELVRAGVEFGPALHLRTLDEARDKLSSGASGPYVLKLNCRSQLHKSAAGLVRFGITDFASLETAVATMPKNEDHDGFMLENQMRADLELFVGGTTDSDFGKMILFGFGGRFAEQLGGTAIWLGDAKRESLDAWLAATPAGRAIAGMDETMFGTVADLVHNALRWFMDSPEIAAFDLNPVFVDAAGRNVCAVDCRVS